jgi:heme-degrading monooxygenase HmoA
MMGILLENIDPPYYTATLNEVQEGIKDRDKIAPADEMVTLAMRQKGFLGLDTSRDKKGDKKTVSYWRNVDDIEKWINAGEYKINHRFGIGLAETCSIDILLVENRIINKKGYRALKNLNTFVYSKINSISGYLS